MLKTKRKKLKIVFITEYFPSTSQIDIQGGVELRTFQLASYLAKNHEVSVICSREKGKPQEQILQKVKIKRVGFRRNYQQKGGFLTRFSFIVLSLIYSLRKKPDLIEGTGLLGYLPALINAKINRARAVAFVPDTFTDFSSHFSKLEGLILKTTEKILLNNFWDGYIVISQTVAEKLKQFAVDKNKIKIIFCPVDLKQIKQTVATKTHYPSLCLISRLVSYKRVDIIIKAVSKLKINYPNLQCHIIGSGNQEKALRNLSQKLKLKQNIIFHGFIPKRSDLLTILKRCWIYVSGSVAEGFGIATIEAMAANVPFVVKDMKINREVTRNSGGLFYKTDEDLQNKLDLLLNNKRLRIKLCQNNQETIDQYDISLIAKQTQSYYQKITR